MLIWSANFGDSGAWRKVRLVAGSFRNTRAPDTCRARRNKPSQRKEPRMCVGKAWRCRRQHKCQDGRQASRRRLAISGAYQRGHEHRRSSMSSFKIGALPQGIERAAPTGHPANCSDKEQATLCVSPSPLVTQRYFHVSALCVEDPSPPSTPTIDAETHRSHPSTPPFVAVIQSP